MAAVFPAQPDPRMTTFRMERNYAGGLFRPNRHASKQRPDYLMKLMQKTTRDFEGEPRAGVGQKEHVAELNDRPFPPAGFAAYDGDGGKALQGECKENQQSHRARRTQIRVQSGLQTF